MTIIFFTSIRLGQSGPYRP